MADARPMIPLAEPDLSGNEARYLAECIETSYVSSIGPFVDRFETMVRDAAGAEDCVATASGTAGLHLALTALGVGRDDLVILPAFTFIASANAIHHCGATPWLVDIAAESWTLDARELRRALADQTRAEAGARIHTASGRRVAAIMPVHTLGLPAELDAIVAIAREFGLAVVADAAAALGAKYRERGIGNTGVDLTVFSFNGNKTVTCGGGGAVVGADGETLALARHLASTARNGEEYDHDQAGFNYRMTNLQAAVGCAQMERLDALVAAKRRIRHIYDAALSGIAGIDAFPDPEWADSACWYSGFALASRRLDSGAGLRARLRDAGIGARPFWKPVHLQPPYAAAPREALPVSEDLWRRIVTLPCSTNLTDGDLTRVIDCVLADPEFADDRR